jgi:seryl-tRNA synthetase
MEFRHFFPESVPEANEQEAIMTSSLSALGGLSASTLSMLEEYMAKQNSQNSEVLSSSYGALSSKVNSTVSNAKSQYEQASVSSEVSQAALNKALAALQANGEDFITFSKISAYQKELEENLSTVMRADLYMLGVPLETNFTMKLSSDGQISVVCDDPAAKQVIEQYLSDNPDVCEQFGYIQALANLDRARQSPQNMNTAMRDAQAQLQASAVEAFMSSSLDSGIINYADMLATFDGSSNSTKFYAGLNFSV